MNHEQCIAALLRALRKSPGTVVEVGSMQEHIANCSDCWKILSLLVELGGGGRPAEADRMGSLLGCGDVEGQLFLVVDLPPGTIGRDYPQMARHLTWCWSCRDRVVEMIQVEAAVSRGEVDTLLAPTLAPRWKETLGAVGETIRELIGRTVIRVEHGAAVLTAIADGLVVRPASAPAGAWRGSSGPGSDIPAGTEVREIEVGLPDSELSANLTFHAQEPRRVGIGLRIHGAQTPHTASLRAVRADGTELMAAHTLRADELVDLGAVPPGDYVLDIREGAQSFKFRVSLTIEAGA